MKNQSVEDGGDGVEIQVGPVAAAEEGQAIIELNFVEEEAGDVANVAVPVLAQGENGNQQDAPNAAQPAAAEANENVFEFRQDITTTNIVSTTMGALFFPTVASLVGEILKMSLPARWVDKNIGYRAAGRAGGSGILKEKWGRTLVGGCLFVVLKDVVTLYCKWKKAKDFGKRRVLDYVGKERRR